MSSDFYATLGILGLFIIIFGFIVVMRYLSYRETLALADKGLVRPSHVRGGSGKDTLRWGIVITAVGMALCVGLYPIGLLPGNVFPLGLGPWMLAGLLPTFFGLGLILIFVLTQDKSEDQTSAGSKNEPKFPVE